MRTKLSILAVSAFLAMPAHASLYNLSLNAGGMTHNVGFGTSEAAFDSFSMSNIEQLIKANGGTFDGRPSAVMDLDYRGVGMRAAYNTNSNALNFRIPELGINQTFYGANREQSLDMLKDWLKGRGGDAANQLSKALVASSPFDPLAGNPNSLMAQMVDGAFDGTNNIGVPGGHNPDNTFDMAISYNHYSIAGKDVKSYRVPMNYTIRFDNRFMRGHRLQFRSPISYTEVDGKAESYALGSGIAYTLLVPFFEQLEITPAYDYGMMVSKDMYSAGIMQSVSLTLRYNFSLFGQNFGFASSVANLSTKAIKYDDIKLDADLDNKAITHGLMWDGKAWGNYNVQAYLKNTSYSGDKLYSERNGEIGMTIGHPKASVAGNPIFVGASYLFTDKSDLDGFKLSIGGSF